MAAAMRKAAMGQRVCGTGVAQRPRATVVRRAAQTETLGFKTMRDGIKEASAESILTPRFYTT
jgi:hypothetical protein